MADYEITVTRTGHVGTLSFTHGEISVNTKCWWDPEAKIDAKPEGYLCWATHMSTKKDSVTHDKRPGIWFGKGVKYAHGTKWSDEIFIHEGKDASWSDRCIVANRELLLQ